MIQNAFLAQARTNPDAVAIVHGDETWTYGVVERQSARLAHSLARAGLGAGSRVAILAERGPSLVWSMLAVLRLGGVFIVLDSAYPEGRLAALMRIGAPNAVVSAGADALQDLAARLAHDDGLPVIDAQSGADGEAATLDRAAPTDPAYFLFTSGSTGAPKCVACSHEPLRHFVAWHAETFSLTAADRFTMLSGLSHDPLLRDVFTPLSIGAALAIPRQSQITEPGALRPWFKAVGATVAHLTPAMGQLLAAGSGGLVLPQLRRMFWGGDQLRPALLDKVAAVAPAAEHVNFYGSTETPQAAAFHRIDRSRPAETIPVGQGSNGFTLLLFDEHRSPTPPGEVGEIAVRSRYLTLGYVDRGQVMVDRDEGPERIYYTGDRGRALPNGDIVVIGRTDDQVKIRGYRVELSEVTAALLSHDRVSAAIALPVGEGPGRRIEAFVAADRQSPDFAREVAAHLAERLPGYMAPSKIWLRERLPLLPNGKIDRRTLQAEAEAPVAPAAPAAAPSANAGAAREAERTLVARWAEMFPGAQVSPATSFVSLGGDSLSYVNAYLAAEEIVGVVPEDWVGKSIAELAAGRVERSRLWSVIDTSMLIRAVSITLIVAYHFHLTKYGDGLTGALLLVSGFLFGGLQMKDVFARASSAPILNSLKNILLPTVAFTALMIGVDLVLLKEPPPFHAYLLSMDMLDHGLNGVVRHDGFLWYVDALLKILLVLYLATLALPRALKLMDRRLEFVAGLFAVGCLGRFVLPFLFQPGFYAVPAPELSLAQFSPFTNFGVFALGMLLGTAQGRARLWALATAGLFALADIPAYGLVHGLAIAGAAAALVLMSRIVLPRAVSAAVFAVSSASLYIYLSHLLFGHALERVHGAPWPLAQFAVAMAGGLAVHAAWTWGMKRLADLRRLLREPPLVTAAS